MLTAATLSVKIQLNRAGVAPEHINRNATVADQSLATAKETEGLGQVVVTEDWLEW